MYNFVKSDVIITSDIMVEFASDIQVQARWAKREGHAPEDPTPNDPSSGGVIKVENTASAKSIILTIVAIILISTGTCIVAKNQFMV